MAYPYTGPCLICETHPDSRHRIVDSIDERIAAGEATADVLNDYGLAPSEFLAIAADVERRLSLVVVPVDGGPNDPGGDGDDGTHEPEQK